MGANSYQFNMYTGWTIIEGDGFIYSAPRSHINSIVGAITNDDIDELFNVEVEIDPDGGIALTPDPFEEKITQEFEIVSDYDAYWLGKGECPKCKDGSKPESIPGGGFKCTQCNNTMDQLK